MRNPTSTSHESSLVLVATIMVRSLKLEIDDKNRLLEDPELLNLFQKLVGLIAEHWGGKDIVCGRISGGPGAYQVELSCVISLLDSIEQITRLLGGHEQDLAVLKSNAKRENPKSARACGVTHDSLRIMQALEALAKAGYRVEVALAGEDPLPRVMSNPGLEVMATLGSVTDGGNGNGDKPVKVDGIVTGISRGDERGYRVQLGASKSFILSGLGLEEVIALFRAGRRIVGTATGVRGSQIIKHYTVAPLVGELDLTN